MSSSCAPSIIALQRKINRMARRINILATRENRNTGEFSPEEENAYGVIYTKQEGASQSFFAGNWYPVIFDLRNYDPYELSTGNTSWRMERVGVYQAQFSMLTNTITNWSVRDDTLTCYLELNGWRGYGFQAFQPFIRPTAGTEVIVRGSVQFYIASATTFTFQYWNNTPGTVSSHPTFRYNYMSIFRIPDHLVDLLPPRTPLYREHKGLNG